MYLGLCWVFTAVQAFSSCGEQGLLPSFSVPASHCSVLLLSMASLAQGFQ